MHKTFLRVILWRNNRMNKPWTHTFFTEPKVCYLHKTLCIKEQVVQFQIPDNNRNVNHTQCWQKRQSTNQSGMYHLWKAKMETIQELTDIQSCDREETVDPTLHRQSRTYWLNIRQKDRWFDFHATKPSIFNINESIDTDRAWSFTRRPTQFCFFLTQTHTHTDTQAAELTQHGAQRTRRHVCASWGLLLPCTPWQNTHVPASGNMQTSWPGRGGGNRWRSQRSASHTSDWRQTREGARVRDSHSTGCDMEDWAAFVRQKCGSKISCCVVKLSYLSTSSLATISPFFSALIAYRLSVFLYSESNTWKVQRKYA